MRATIPELLGGGSGHIPARRLRIERTNQAAMGDGGYGLADPGDLGNPGTDPLPHLSRIFTAGSTEIPPPRVPIDRLYPFDRAQVRNRPALPCAPIHLDEPRLDRNRQPPDQESSLPGPGERAGDPARRF